MWCVHFLFCVAPSVNVDTLFCRVSCSPPLVVSAVRSWSLLFGCFRLRPRFVCCSQSSCVVSYILLVSSGSRRRVSRLVRSLSDPVPLSVFYVLAPRPVPVLFRFLCLLSCSCSLSLSLFCLLCLCPGPFGVPCFHLSWWPPLKSGLSLDPGCWPTPGLAVSPIRLRLVSPSLGLISGFCPRCIWPYLRSLKTRKEGVIP